ncbi:hypothetical protein OAG51_03045 [Pirellulaceae bacterium]|jgi:hypothetical protein|nr:hypothetical protein [Pirellulaceae bacterium]
MKLKKQLQTMRDYDLIDRLESPNLSKCADGAPMFVASVTPHPTLTTAAFYPAAGRRASQLNVDQAIPRSIARFVIAASSGAADSK